MFRVYWNRSALLAAVVAAGTANADPIGQLLISSDGTTVTVPLTGSSLTANYTNLNFNGWSINFALALSGAPNSVTLLSLLPGFVTCAASPCVSDPLQFTVTGTGFIVPVVDFNLGAAFVGLASGLSWTSQAFWDPSDGLGAETSPIGTLLTFTGPTSTGDDNTSGGGPAGPSPFSLTTVDTFIATSVGSSITTSSSVVTGSVIPEPATWSLVGIGFATLGGIAYRRRKRASVPDQVRIPQ